MRTTIRRESLLLKNVAVPYRIRKHPRSRQLRITINALGEVIVTIPRWASFRSGVAFAKEHTQWVQKHLDGAAERLEYRNGLGVEEHFNKYREEARRFIRRKIEQWNAVYGFSYGSVAIRNQATRWGSCSRQNNLNFNYRLMFLDEKLVDYVIVHELCHTQEHNHSSDFWKLVQKTIPDYQARRNELQKY